MRCTDKPPARRSLAHYRLLTAGSCAPFALLLASCALEADATDGPEPEPLGQVAYALGTVQDAINNSCTTTSVFGLSKQIVDGVNCLIPGALAEVPDRPNLSKSAATFAYLQTAARDHFVSALNDNPGKQLDVSSMLRTVAQQYLLYAWYQAGKCGIPLAAKPGNSNHEDGLAFDTGDYSTWTSAMSSHSFKWYGSSDKYHFDYVGSGGKDLGGKDVLVFQKLWNLNNAGDLIDEDGAYGPQTEARLKKSPADGFPKGLDCSGPPALDATFVSQGSDAPADPNGKAHFQVCTGATFHFWFELKNKGSATWVDDNNTAANAWGHAVRLGTPGDKADVFTGKTRESVNGNANNSVDPKGGDCNDKPGCSKTVFVGAPGIVGKAPSTPGTYKTTWRLVDEGRGWFGPTMWLDFAVVDCAVEAGADQAVVPSDATVDKKSEAASPSDSAPLGKDGSVTEAGGRDGGSIDPNSLFDSGNEDSGCTCAAPARSVADRAGLAVALLAFIGMRRRRR